MYSLLVTYKFDSMEKRDGFYEAVTDDRIAYIVKKEDGCVTYDYEVPEEPTVLILHEEWETKEHQIIHTKQPTMNRIKGFKSRFGAETIIEELSAPEKETSKADITKTIKSLESNNYTVKYFENAEAAAEWLDAEIDGEVVGFGDSQTMIKMKLFDRLSSHNTVYDPNQSEGEDVDPNGFHDLARQALLVDSFLTSVNAMSETGEMINIDGTGNRVAGSLFGHKKIYFIVGTNKIEPSLERAMWRAKNIASPMNSLKYNLPTPCVAHYKQTGEYKCFDCNSPQRICNATVVYQKRMEYLDDAVIVLIDEKLGF